MIAGAPTGHGKIHLSFWIGGGAGSQVCLEIMRRKDIRNVFFFLKKKKKTDIKRPVGFFIIQVRVHVHPGIVQVQFLQSSSRPLVGEE